MAYEFVSAPKLPARYWLTDDTGSPPTIELRERLRAYKSDEPEAIAP